MIRKFFFLSIFLLCVGRSLYATTLAKQLSEVGYFEMCDREHGSSMFDALYARFDEFITFLQKNPMWAHTLYSVKERFIRSKDKKYYSTEFFGFYDESKREGRNQISFYYSIHFYEFIRSFCSECMQVPQIKDFFEECIQIQKAYMSLCDQTADELGMTSIFASEYEHVPVLFKVIKYLPSYIATSPHYDGTAFSFFLDSTDNQSLLLSPYKTSFFIDDFFSPPRNFSRSHTHNSILLIPGTLITEFSMYPTPHIVVPSGKTRYATIAFAMRPQYLSQQSKFSSLPSFKH